MTEIQNPRIDYREYMRWRQQYFAMRGTLRLGQAFVNQKLPAGVVDPGLFYENNDDRAEQLILYKYVNMDEGQAGNAVDC